MVRTESSHYALVSGGYSSLKRVTTGASSPSASISADPVYWEACVRDAWHAKNTGTASGIVDSRRASFFGRMVSDIPDEEALNRFIAERRRTLFERQVKWLGEERARKRQELVEKNAASPPCRQCGRNSVLCTYQEGLCSATCRELFMQKNPPLTQSDDAPKSNSKPSWLEDYGFPGKEYKESSAYTLGRTTRAFFAWGLDNTKDFISRFRQDKTYAANAVIQYRRHKCTEKCISVASWNTINSALQVAFDFAQQHKLLSWPGSLPSARLGATNAADDSRPVLSSPTPAPAAPPPAAPPKAPAVPAVPPLPLLSTTWTPHPVMFGNMPIAYFVLPPGPLDADSIELIRKKVDALLRQLEGSSRESSPPQKS